MIKAIFFDLDGTLLPMDEESFTKGYFSLLCKKVIPLGYDPNQLIKVIWEGTQKMYLNTGIQSNEYVFWNYFETVYGKEKAKDKIVFDFFYRNEFRETISFCGKNEMAKQIIDTCHELVKYVVLATNPIFPSIGTEMRMSFVGLKKQDFNFVTVYENSSFCKPNPEYFRFLLKKYGLNGNEVLMFGNNTLEDGECALACGIKCYLVGNNIIYNPKSQHKFIEISMEEIIPTIKKEILFNQ